MSLSPRDMLARLVAFPTVSARSNLDLIGFVREHLAAQAIACRTIPNADGTKANLWATVGPELPGGVVLSGHTDVVPVEGQAWSSDPFALTERDARLYGRGTADMKGFLAIVLALVPEMAKAGLKRPIHIALSYDEEVGCLGAPAMIDDMVAQGLRPSAVLVGEPSSLRVVTRHKGFLGLDTVVTGHEVHSSQLHRGVSAVTVAARLIAWLADRTEENAARAGDPLFDPPFTTLHCGRVEGGTAHNIVARSCRFTTDIRNVPADDPEAIERAYLAEVARLEAAMRARAPGTGIAVTRFACVPGLGPEPNGAAEGLARRLTGDNGEHVVPFSSEAGQFQAAGFSTAICGPGDIAQAHQPDEFIAIAQFEAGIAFLRRLVADLAR